MPFASDTFAPVAQSLHAMQCVRLVEGFGMLGHEVWNAASCVSNTAVSDASVKSVQLLKPPVTAGCRASSNPCWVSRMASASLMGVTAPTYEVKRRHDGDQLLGSQAGLPDMLPVFRNALSALNCTTRPRVPPLL